MTATPEQLRGELLRTVWQAGPLGRHALLRTGAQMGMSATQVSKDLALLCGARLIHVDAHPPGPACYGPALDAEDAARREYGRLSGSATCRVCGCSNDWACDDGCWWAEDDLCTSCVDPREGEA